MDGQHPSAARHSLGGVAGALRRVQSSCRATEVREWRKSDGRKEWYEQPKREFLSEGCLR